jgi:hypothetical protein
LANPLPLTISVGNSPPAVTTAAHPVAVREASAATGSRDSRTKAARGLAPTRPGRANLDHLWEGNVVRATDTPQDNSCRFNSRVNTKCGPREPFGRASAIQRMQSFVRAAALAPQSGIRRRSLCCVHVVRARSERCRRCDCYPLGVDWRFLCRRTLAYGF